MAAAGATLTLVALLWRRPGLDPDGLPVATVVLLVLGLGLLAAGTALLARAADDRWRPPAVVAGCLVAVFGLTSDRLGLGAGGGVGAKQLVLVAIGALVAAVAAPPASRAALVSALRRVPAGVWIVFGLGALVRLWFMYSYRPGFLGFADAEGYLTFGSTELFRSPYRPAGEPLFVRAIRHLSPDLSFTVLAHHALGFATALVLFLALRRAGAPRWAGLVPAGVVLLSGTQLFLEHSVLSEPLFTFLVAASAYCAVRAGAGGGGWILAAGALCGVSAAVRPVGVFLLPVVATWAAFHPGTDLRAGLRRAGLVLAGGAVVVGAYLGAHANVTGHWGLTRTQGETLYARVAAFADCSEFEPPAGTAVLCQKTPRDDRPPANVYMFQADQSPALRAFGFPPEVGRARSQADYRWGPDEKLGEFGRAAIRGQPLDYAESVALGFANYFTPGRVGPRAVSDWDTRVLVGVIRGPRETQAVANLAAYYETTGYLRRNATALDRYGRLARLEGLPTAALTLLALAGLVAGRRLRYEESLFLGLAAALMLSSVAILYYDARYATPAYGFLAAAAALGLAGLTRGGSPTAGTSASCPPRRGVPCRAAP